MAGTVYKVKCFRDDGTGSLKWEKLVYVPGKEWEAGEQWIKEMQAHRGDFFYAVTFHDLKSRKPRGMELYTD